MTRCSLLSLNLCIDGVPTMGVLARSSREVEVLMVCGSRRDSGPVTIDAVGVASEPKFAGAVGDFMNFS